MSEDSVTDPGQQPVPLLRDPPPPPGYEDPLDGVGILDEPFRDLDEDRDDR